VNKWTALARERRGARTLAQATAGDMKQARALVSPDGEINQQA
jgi:hypothetical protein